MSTITPNMNLIESTVNVDSGLSWEQNLNSSLTRIDGHDHTSGNGVQIPPAGLNINSNLTFQNNAATNVSYLGFTVQTSVTTLTSLYSKGVDLYFRDGASNEVRITTGGTVNATSSGISSGTNTASFVANVLVVQSAASTPADVDCGSIILRNLVASSKGLTLSPPAAMGSNFSLTLPSIPASTMVATLDSSGNFGTSLVTESLMGPLSVGTPELIASSVTTAKIADQSVTISKQAPMPASAAAGIGEIAISASSGAYTNFTTAYTTVASVTLVTSGRPVQLMMISAAAGAGSAIGSTATSALEINTQAAFRFVRSGTPIAECYLTVEQSAASAGSVVVLAQMPPGILSHIDPVAAGGYTYVLQAKALAATQEAFVTACKLVAYEI